MQAETNTIIYDTSFSPDCSNQELSVEENSNHESSPCQSNDTDDGGTKEGEEDWFWSQVALQVDTSTPPGRKATPTRKNTRTNTRPNLTKKVLNEKNSSTCRQNTNIINKPTSSSSRVNTGQPPSRYHCPQTVHTLPPSQPYRHHPPPSHNHGCRPHTTHDPPPSQKQGHTSKQNDWDTWEDDEFIDQLLTQGVGLDPLQYSGQPKVGEVNSNRPQKSSAEEIQAKRERARRKLAAKLGKK